MKKEDIYRELAGRFSLRKKKFIADNYLLVEVQAEDLLDFLSFCKEKLEFGHFTSITCVDYPKQNSFSLSYNLFSYQNRVLITVKIYIERNSGEFQSVSGIYYPARFFERDIYEMFGINFIGNEYQGKFILDEWEGRPPMRKDFDTRRYVDEHFKWRIYQPQWAKDLGIKPEDLEGKDLELL